MNEEIIIAGFGGQGILSMGKILAYSSLVQDMEVSWMPSYGPEMRGGTANVTVILSDKKISSPSLKMFDTGIILNQQSLDKFEDCIKPGGMLIYDGNGITRHPERKDIKVIRVDASEEAAKLGNVRIFNMIMLGAYLKLKPVLSRKSVLQGLKKSIPVRHYNLMRLNLRALITGTRMVQETALA